MGDLFPWLISAGTILVGLLTALCTVLVPLAIVGALVVYLVRRGQKVSAARQAAQAWPSTPGQVLASTIQVHRSADSRTEVPVVMYQYQVGGQTYQGRVIRAGDQYGTIRFSGEAQATVERYPVGAAVTVYYNPANPAESALER